MQIKSVFYAFVPVVTLLSVACGGASKQASSPSDLESGRGTFVKSCVESAGAGMDAFCNCGFDQYKAMGGFANDGNVPKEKTDELQRRTLAQCGDKAPESMIKTNFVSGCASSKLREQLGEPGANNYCGCLWTELRTKYNHPLADFLGTNDAATANLTSNATKIAQAGTCAQKR